MAHEPEDHRAGEIHRASEDHRVGAQKSILSAAKAQDKAELSAVSGVDEVRVVGLGPDGDGTAHLAASVGQRLAHTDLRDNCGQPLGSNKAPDPTSDGFYHELTELTSRHLLIDKTDFLTSYLSGESRCDLIARPLGMGKTVLLKIIAALYSGRRDLLPPDLAVLKDWAESEKDVIYLDFAQLCYADRMMVRHSYPLPEELIQGPYICGNMVTARRRSQGLCDHIGEREYQFYQGDSFVSNVYAQFYQQCTRAADAQAIISDEEAQVHAEDFSGILSSTVDRTALLQLIRLFSACQENSRVLIIDNIDAPLLSAMHLPECYNLRAGFLSRLLLLLSKHGAAFRHILLSAQCALPELGWEPNQDGVVITSQLNTERWQSDEFALRLGFTCDELKAQVPAEVKERARDYLSLNHVITNEDALWQLFAQNFGGYSIDCKHEVLLPRLVIAQLLHPDQHFNPVLTYDHGAPAGHEHFEAMPDLDVMYLHTISRMPFEALIHLFHTMLSGRCYAKAELYQLPLTIPGYPDEIPGRSKTDFEQDDKLNRSAAEALASLIKKHPDAEPSAAEQSADKSEDKEAEPAAGKSGGKSEDKFGDKAEDKGEDKSGDKAEDKPTDQAADDALEHYAVQPAAALEQLSQQVQARFKAVKPRRRRRKLSAKEQAAREAAAQDHIGAILGFGERLIQPKPLLTPEQRRLQDIIKYIHTSELGAKSVQDGELDYSKVQKTLQALEFKAKGAGLQDLMRDVDLVGYFDESPPQRSPAVQELENTLRLTVEQANAIAESKPDTNTPAPDVMSAAPAVDDEQAQAARQVALSVISRKRALDNKVLKSAFAFFDAKAEGGYPAVDGSDLVALDQLSVRSQTGATGVQIDEDAAAQIMAELHRLDLMRMRVSRARNAKKAGSAPVAFGLADLLRSLGFLTYSQELSLPNIDLVPNRYVYRKLRLMVLNALFFADRPLNTKSEDKLAEALGPSPRPRRKIEYDFSAGMAHIEEMRKLFELSGFSAMFHQAVNQRSDEELRQDMGMLPEVTLSPDHFFPVKGQAPVYVPLLTNIINWLNVAGPITLSANAINAAIALFCQLHMQNNEDLALGHDIKTMLTHVSDLEEQCRKDEQRRREEELERCEIQKIVCEAYGCKMPTYPDEEQKAPELHDKDSADASNDASVAASTAASAPQAPAHKSPAEVHGLFIYDEDTARDPELEAQALAQLQPEHQAESNAPADAAEAQQPEEPSEEPSLAGLLNRAQYLTMFDESYRGINFSTRPIEDDRKARDVVEQALNSGDFDLSRALMEVADAQTRRHHNLTIYTPGSAIVVELALANSEDLLPQVTNIALHNLVRVDSPLLAALNKHNPREFETTQVQRVLLVGVSHQQRVVVRKVLVVDVNVEPAHF